MKYLRTLIVKMVPDLWLMKARLALVNFDKSPPILVYQMGKVGSSSVYESLKRAGLANPVYQVHFLSYSHLDEIEQYHRSLGAQSSIDMIHFWRELRHKLDRTKAPVYLISLVRDPVAREISNIFQNIDSHREKMMTASGEIDVEKTINFLGSLFANHNEATDFACTWFDKEILDTYGIDVFAHPFDHKRGFSIIANDRAKLLLLRMEDLPNVFTEAMREFMGLSMPLVHANESASKDYSEAYNAVLKRITLPRADIEKIYSTRFVQHFYSEEVRAESMKKWISTNMVCHDDTCQ